MDEFLYELKLYERLGWEIMEEEGIRREEVEQALTGFGGPDPRFYPIEACDPLDHERSWYAYAIINAVYEARRLYAEGGATRAVADMFHAGYDYQSALVSLYFPETRKKLDRLWQSKGGVASGESRREEMVERDNRIVSSAKKLLESGIAPHELCSFMKANGYGFELSTRRLREILKREGIIGPKKWK